jgi:hypothetical protein
VNGSGGRLRAAWYMDAGAQPRGGRVRVFLLVTVEVSCRVDPVRVRWAGVGGQSAEGWWIFGAKWSANPGAWGGFVLNWCASCIPEGFLRDLAFCCVGVLLFCGARMLVLELFLAVLVSAKLCM